MDLKVEIFLSIYKIASHKNQDVAKSTLFYALESEIYYAKIDLQATKKQRLPFLEKISTALHIVEVLVSIQKALMPLLPEANKDLSRYVEHSGGSSISKTGQRKDYYSKFRTNRNALSDDSLALIKKVFNIQNKETLKKEFDQVTRWEASKLAGWDELLESTLAE